MQICGQDIQIIKAWRQMTESPQFFTSCHCAGHFKKTLHMCCYNIYHLGLHSFDLFCQWLFFLCNIPEKTLTSDISGMSHISLKSLFRSLSLFVFLCLSCGPLRSTQWRQWRDTDISEWVTKRFTNLAPPSFSHGWLEILWTTWKSTMNKNKKSDWCSGARAIVFLHLHYPHDCCQFGQSFKYMMQQWLLYLPARWGGAAKVSFLLSNSDVFMFTFILFGLVFLKQA